MKNGVISMRGKTVRCDEYGLRCSPSFCAEVCKECKPKKKVKAYKYKSVKKAVYSALEGGDKAICEILELVNDETLNGDTSEGLSNKLRVDPNITVVGTKYIQYRTSCQPVNVYHLNEVRG